MKRLVLVLSLLLPFPARAFHVAEHVQITERAIRELHACGLLPARWTDSFTELVEKADENEDLDLYRKWTSYSHYFNPYHPLDQRRSDSMTTITESVAALEANPHDDLNANKLLGRMIHHVQDSSTPAHAVPVEHSFRDGFETFPLSDYYASALSPAACKDILPGRPADVLRANAIATLESLRSPAIGAETWQSGYWHEGQGNAFGSYGAFGNAFGAAKVRLVDGGTAPTPPSLYQAFKRVRVEAAVRATEAVILWANGVRGF